MLYIRMGSLVQGSHLTMTLVRHWPECSSMMAPCEGVPWQLEVPSAPPPQPSQTRNTCRSARQPLIGSGYLH